MTSKPLLSTPPETDQRRIVPGWLAQLTGMPSSQCVLAIGPSVRPDAMADEELSGRMIKEPLGTFGLALLEVITDWRVTRADGVYALKVIRETLRRMRQRSEVTFVRADYYGQYISGEVQLGTTGAVGVAEAQLDPALVAGKNTLSTLRGVEPPPNKWVWVKDLDAELAHEFRRHGAQSVAYGSIVAAGANACVLHYRADAAPVRSGDLVLIDAGCELDGYASDITRTFPVNGKFTGPQRDVYQAVLDAELACMEALKPGNPFNEYHEVAIRVLSQRMLDLGLLKGTLDQVIEEKTYTKFYMHRAGHWIGMDVHDAGVYYVDEATIGELNREHLGGAGPTDVLSFPIDTEAPPATAPDPTRVVGDIVVCPSTAERQAPGHSGDPHDEIAVLLVHAALHLVGHDHAEADERDRMWRAEQQALAAHWRPLQRDPWAARSDEVVP